jgi:predicted Na+-dependent transporter
MKSFAHYLVGLAATFAGAYGTELTQSMLPLALGAAVSLMTTAPFVRTLWSRRRR